LQILLGLQTRQAAGSLEHASCQAKPREYTLFSCAKVGQPRTLFAARCRRAASGLRRAAQGAEPPDKQGCATFSTATGGDKYSQT
jgi:hypothetical protein